MLTFTLVSMTLLKCVVSALQEDIRPYLNSSSSNQTVGGPCLNRPYHFKFLKGCLPETSLVPFYNTLYHKKLIKFPTK